MNKEIVDFLKKIEAYLITCNIEISITQKIMNFLVYKVMQNENISRKEIIDAVASRLQIMANEYIANINIDEQRKQPYVMILCGVNGVGKTTTIGKMVSIFKKSNYDVMVATCDTYRPAANSQLMDCSGLDANDFICMSKETDVPYKIAVKAYNTAVERGKDILIIDTSGRLHNNQNLMAELLKIKYKLHEISFYIPNDVVLIVDASGGYNLLEQAKMYNDLIGITGIIATKLDIARKPGIILSICEKFNIKIFGICDGEERNKIRELEPKSFADAILSDINDIM